MCVLKNQQLKQQPNVCVRYVYVYLLNGAKYGWNNLIWNVSALNCGDLTEMDAEIGEWLFDECHKCNFIEYNRLDQASPSPSLANAYERRWLLK